jgi:hypothetical protein
VCSTLEIPDEALKKLTKLIFRFVWNNKTERIKRSILITDIKHGGLKIPDAETIIKTLKLKWIHKLATHTTSTWKLFLESYLDKHKINLNILLYSNFSMHTLGLNQQNIPEFYFRLLKLWSEVGNTTPVNKEETIWYNRNILINHKAVFYLDFLQSGIRYISDLYDDTGAVIPFQIWINRGVNPNKFLKWRGLISATAKCSRNALLFSTAIKLCIHPDKPITELNNNLLYRELLSIKTGQDVNIPKIIKYLDNNQAAPWEDIYLRGNQIPIDTKTKEFQYKFIHDILSNRYWLHKWGIVESPRCIYCDDEDNIENIKHMFWTCEQTTVFWNIFEQLYSDKIHPIQLDENMIFVGVEDIQLCSLIFAAKMYIYHKRVHDEPIIFAGFVMYLNKN